VKTNVFIPAQLLVWYSTYFTVPPNDPATEVRHGTECFQDFQKANAKRRLARPAGAAQQTTEGMLEL
jgi:hypothetical protein